MFNFNPNTSHAQSGDLIPDNYACWAVVSVRGYKASQKTGGHYLDIELTVADGQPMNRRKLWTVVMDPADQGNSEQGRQMGLAALQHMLESCGVFNPAQPESYAQFNQSGIQGIAAALQEKMVAIVVGIEKGKDGYADKNKVKKWLSPNANSPSVKEFQALVQGGAVLPKAAPSRAAPQPGLFGGGAPAPTPAPVQSGFVPQQPAAPAQPMSPPPATMPMQPAAAPRPGGAPAWLAGSQG